MTVSNPTGGIVERLTPRNHVALIVTLAKKGEIDALEAADRILAALPDPSGGWRGDPKIAAIRDAITNWFAPWGSWKTAWWEDFGGDGEYTAERFIKGIGKIVGQFPALPAPPDQEAALVSDSGHGALPMPSPDTEGL
jgi:hypothetical protein